LLKSQYNHINHLDTKLNEVVGSVFALEQKFTHLEKNFSHLEQKLSSDMANLEQKVSSDIANLDQKLRVLISSCVKAPPPENFSSISLSLGAIISINISSTLVLPRAKSIQ
jgi:hypothetical protein